MERPVVGRFTLRKNPNQYYRDVKCPHCGSKDVRSVEKQRRAEQDKKDVCYCNMVPFPHTKGTILGCTDHPKEEWNDEDHEKYQAMLATPRSS